MEEIFPPPQPSKKTLHIVVRPPTVRESSFLIVSLCALTSVALSYLNLSSATITASRDSNLAAYSKQVISSHLSRSVALKRSHPDSPDDLDGSKRARHNDDDAWLLELHSKIWGREDRWHELFHTIEITTAHYDELQERLDKLNPDRRTGGYFARADSAGVLSTKLEVLRNFKPPSVAPAPELAAHADNWQANNNEEEEEENDDNDDPRSLFPVKIQYLDLSCLERTKLRSQMPLLNSTNQLPICLSAKARTNFLFENRFVSGSTVSF